MILRNLSIALIFTALTSSAFANDNAYTHNFIAEYSASIYYELVEFRRDLFRHPEASGEEKRTSAQVAKYLTDLGLEVKTNVGGYGVVGILKGGKKGKRIAWRADMDGAKFEHSHSDGEEFGDSDVGHVCGHDVHTTIGVGIANVLSQKREHLAGEVYFLFQPAEENQLGAKAMISDGLFDLIKPDEIYAAHVAPMETGVISTRPGNLFAHARRMKVSFNGTDDREGLTSAVTSIMNSLVHIQSPAKFNQLQNVVDPDIGLSNPNSIYTDYVMFSGNPSSNQRGQNLEFQTEIFVTSLEELTFVEQKIKQMIGNTKYSARFRSVQYFHDREGVNNDSALVQSTTTALRDLYGEEVESINYGQIPYSSEDFGHFQRTVPGVYFFLGASNAKLGINAFPHMPGFEVDETSIKVGVSYFSSLIIDRASSSK